MKKWQASDTEQGEITRGKTARNRLRRVDLFLALHERRLLQRADGPFQDAWFVDLGYGEKPYTVLESARNLRRVNPGLPVLGIEIDPQRVAQAQLSAGSGIEFREGGFTLPLGPGESVRLIRAFNVLRQYEEDTVAEVHHQLCAQLLPGGLLIEGTSSPFGRIWTANLLRTRPAAPPQQALLFSTNFKQGFDPADFQAVLPKNYIHRMLPGEPIHQFFADWRLAYQRTMGHRSLGRRHHFSAAAHALADMGYSLTLRGRLLRRGFLLWQMPEQR